MSNLLQIFLFFSVMNLPNGNNFEEPLQCALNSDKLETLIEREAKDVSHLPVIIVTNGHISTDMELTMFDQDVQLVENASGIADGQPYLNIAKTKINEKSGKAEFHMTYQQSKILIRLRKEEGKWILRSFFSKQKKNRTYDVEF